MRKILIVLVLCAVLVSAVSVTSVVSARQVGSNTVKQSGIFFKIAQLYKFWRSKLNPTQIPINTPIALLVIGIATLIMAPFGLEDNLAGGSCYIDPHTGEITCPEDPTSICFYDPHTGEFICT